VDSLEYEEARRNNMGRSMLKSQFWDGVVACTEVKMGYNILGCLKFMKSRKLDFWCLGNVIEELMKIPLHTILCTVYEFEHRTLLTMKACILYKYFVKMPYNCQQYTNFMIVCTTRFSFL